MPSRRGSREAGPGPERERVALSPSLGLRGAGRAHSREVGRREPRLSSPLSSPTPARPQGLQGWGPAQTGCCQVTGAGSRGRVACSMGAGERKEDLWVQRGTVGGSQAASQRDCR